jgi:ABC-type amino acid transport substrate-binding protein
VGGIDLVIHRSHRRLRDPLALAGIVAGTLLAAFLAYVLWPRIVPPARDLAWERIEAEGRILIGMDASYPPFEFVNGEGILMGYDVDLAHRIGEELGVEAHFVSVARDGFYDALAARKVDAIISALPYDATQTQDVAYSPEYFDAGQVLLVREDERSIASADDLGGRVVGVELGSGAHMELARRARRTDFELRFFASTEAAIQALVAGQMDAAATDAVAAYGFGLGHGGVKQAGKSLTEEAYVIAVRIDSFMLGVKLNEALSRLSQEGFVEDLNMRWF